MKKPKLQISVGWITALIVFVLVVAATWFARGFYDKLTLLEGEILVVNATEKGRKIQLQFPSGEKGDFDLNAGASSSASISKTGEGAINVLVDTNRKEEVGYVTTWNGMMILAIRKNASLFPSFLCPCSEVSDLTQAEPD